MKGQQKRGESKKASRKQLANSSPRYTISNILHSIPIPPGGDFDVTVTIVWIT